MTRILLNLTLCLISVSINAQNQDSFTDVVKEYKNEIENVMAIVAPINIEKEVARARKTCNHKAVMDLHKKEFKCKDCFGEYFIASGNKYRIERNPSENVMMTISFINSKGERKIQKKKVKDIVAYLCNKEIPADSIKVTSIQVFKIYDIAESAEHSSFLFKKNILYIDGYSTYDIDKDGRISKKK